MTTAEQDQLAATARDAGHAAKDGEAFAFLEPEEQEAFNMGVHLARELIRAGIGKEDASEVRNVQALVSRGMTSTLLAFINETSPSISWTAI
jgi:hypothetical protein